jgi:hypothetical protein
MLILKGFPHGSPIPLTGLVNSAHLDVLRCQMGIQSGANKYQNDRGQEDGSVVGAETEGAGAAGKKRHEFNEHGASFSWHMR